MPVTIAIRAHGAIEEVRLDRPDRLNGFNLAMIAALGDYFTGLAQRPEVRVVLLTGAGRAFCAGMDLAESPSAGKQGAERLAAMMGAQAGLSRIILAMRRCPQPIVGLINGPAAGGGFSLALATDVRIGTAAAKLVPSFVHIGLSGGELGTSYFLPRMIGASRAAELLMTGRTLPAEEALALGLYSRVVAGEALHREGMAVAEAMLRVSPIGLRMTKEVLALNLDAPSLEAAIAIENRTQNLCGMTEDCAEGVAAFLAKRPPEYRGR